MLNKINPSHSLLGINARSLLFLRPHNFAEAIQIADNKLQTKKVLAKAKIPVPKTIAVIKSRVDLFNFDWSKLPASFVLKPALGMMGEGIVIAYGQKKNGNWVRLGGQEIDRDDLFRHIMDILDGEFNKSGVPDIAFFEERLKLDPEFKLYAHKGLPDIRVIVYNGIPIMAMFRLPTRKSGGRANLSQGGIGIGLDIATGQTTNAVVKGKWFERPIETLPGTNLKLRGLQIPSWNRILHLAIEAARAVGLGFAGIDIAFDKERGPVILEVNARPGLSIQNANLAPLYLRLQRVEGLKVANDDKAIQIAKDLFGNVIEKEVQEISGRKVIGRIEKVKIFHPQTAEKYLVNAKVDTGADSSSIDRELAKKLGFTKLLTDFDDLPKPQDFSRDDAKYLEAKIADDLRLINNDLASVKIVYSASGVSIRPAIKLTFSLGGRKMESVVSIAERSQLAYSMIIGRKDLKQFFIDPIKK